MAAQEPLPQSLLQQMGLDNAMKQLPGQQARGVGQAQVQVGSSAQEDY